MIELTDKHFQIDGISRLIVSGEVHYFRLKRADWQDRLTKLKQAGCNCVASYVPWLCHEFVEGQFDLDGRSRPELDLGGFIDLCRDNGLYFFARPGPFIMAEMKNEGLPYWVYKKHPETIPVTWDGKLVPTRTLDYLAPGFLEETFHWYAAVMPVLAPRLSSNGGNIIAVQLDNEVGMLSWISNAPDLTDTVLDDFVAWLSRQYSNDDLWIRYPFSLDHPTIRAAGFRSPKEDYALRLRHDLGCYMRARCARYVATLRRYAEEHGVKDVPFVINIHGTAGGRALTFPVGISQLYEAYTQAPGYVSGSDHYLGDLHVHNFQDLYLMNALMDAVNRPEQPLTSVEFEAGSGDYGDRYSGRHDPSSVDFKTRMCIAQGNRLVSYYLFAGGFNYLLDSPVHDGNDRISFTGERHGTAAPLNPEGQLSYTFPRMARGLRAVMAVQDKLAVMHEEHDGLALGFIPDYFMTEFTYPKSNAMATIVSNLAEHRGENAWDVVVRTMLLGSYRFGAVDIQNGAPDPTTTPVLVLPSARYMGASEQRRLVEYLTGGAGVLLYGELPESDMEGNPCTVLIEALGLTPAGTRRAESSYYLSVTPAGWAAPRPEVRAEFAQLFEPSRGEVIMRVADTGEACGFDLPVGRGRAIVLSASYTSDVPFFKTALERLGAPAALSHDCPDFGIFMTSSASRDGERFLHLLNLDAFSKELHLTENGEALLDGRILALAPREGLMLPLNVSFGDVCVVYSTAEIMNRIETGMEVRLTQRQDVIALRTDRAIAESEDYSVETQGGIILITSRKHAAVDDRLLVRWN